MNCKNLRIRTKKSKKYGYCTKYKKEVPLYCKKDCVEYKTINKIKGNKHKLTKATDIPKSVKMTVWERDNHRCIFCGRLVDWNYANSHFIKRSHGGLGIEQNIMTNCTACHNNFDNSIYRKDMMAFAREYLKSKYDGWNEQELVYRK